MRFNIQTKLFVLMTGLTAAALFGVLLSISQVLEEKIREKVFHDFNRMHGIFRNQEKLRYDLLFESAILIGENSAFKATVKLEDPPTVSHFVENEFAPIAKFDLCIVTDQEGKVLARFGEPERFGDDLTGRPSVQRALQGEIGDVEAEGFWPELWEVDHQLFQVVSVPVYLGGGVIGTITEGAQITQYEAVQLKGDGVIDITFALGAEPMGSTIKDLQAEDWNAFRASNQDNITAVLEKLEATQPFEAVLGGEQVFVFISPLGRGEAAYYVATVPQRFELQILKDLQENIYLTAVISILITIILAFVLGRTLSRPILRLVDGMNKVKAGDLDVELWATSRDEIGLLTNTFNEMIVGLRERLHLMKYVGSHTIDMIQQASGGEVSLGGSRRELAVLFTDIRGFTSFSEKRPPEEVISMLNRYLGFQAEIVPRYEGSIDKFVGDEMVALFTGDKALERAINCAVEIQRRIRLEHQTDPVPINIGIGVNYGPVILGNMGAENRLDYTVIGAEVNLGARLCSAAAGGQILIRRELLDGLELSAAIAGTQMMSFKGMSEELEIAEVSSA
jgi:class 3 adenylate cyclase